MVDEIVAEYAYRIYEHRIANGISGDDVSDWYKARRQYDDECEQARIELAAHIMKEIRREFDNDDCGPSCPGMCSRCK